MTRPGEEALAAQLKLGLDLEAVNADGTAGDPDANDADPPIAIASSSGSMSISRTTATL